MSINTITSNPIILNELLTMASSAIPTGGKLLATLTQQQPNQTFAAFSLFNPITVPTEIGKTLIIQVSGSCGNSSAFGSSIGLYINNSLFKKLDLKLAPANTPFTMSWDYLVISNSTKIDIQAFSGCNTTTDDYVCVNIYQF